ncbi:MAG: STAS domain-containing protein [Verrucomicrobiales bacterium]|nr:STAS domain-containing protein [Verrucomicrobiales bacterium]
MTPSSSRIVVLVEPPTAYLRVAGRAAVERARDFKLLVQRLNGQGIRKFCLDLTECRIMDSTFSGVLAALASELGPVAEGAGTRFVLVNPNERVRDLLDNLGVLPLVTVLEGTSPEGPTTGAEELARGSESRAETTECCLDAHRFLMALSPQNIPKFRDLTRVLEAERSAAEKG